MPKHPMGGARIAKPSARLTPEDDAARFVLAWERRLIRNGRAWRNPKTKELMFESPPWAIKLRSWHPDTGHRVHYVSVPQSTLAVRPDGCTCSYYVHGNHASWTGGCPLYVPPEP